MVNLKEAPLTLPPNGLPLQHSSNMVPRIRVVEDEGDKPPSQMPRYVLRTLPLPPLVFSSVTFHFRLTAMATATAATNSVNNSKGAPQPTPKASRHTLGKPTPWVAEPITDNSVIRASTPRTRTPSEDSNPGPDVVAGSQANIKAIQDTIQDAVQKAIQDTLQKATQAAVHKAADALQKLTQEAKTTPSLTRKEAAVQTNLDRLTDRIDALEVRREQERPQPALHGGQGSTWSRSSTFKNTLTRVKRFLKTGKGPGDTT
ncbi:hypothetical protein C8Q76DRAFT_794933 [Earliella scabrosa]|nr:hypothetical protein C8Q76DRAFT_794933 [Earliella scabrosa]